MEKLYKRNKNNLYILEGRVGEVKITIFENF